MPERKEGVAIGPVNRFYPPDGKHGRGLWQKPKEEAPLRQSTEHSFVTETVRVHKRL